ncbi:unnamed protein product, partial [Ectocarpus sp. 4 AP-2014]
VPLDLLDGCRNGYDGVQIVPRFATYVYFNCVTGSTCTSTADECVNDDGATDIQSFGDIEALFDAEASTTTRYMLTGRRS